MIPIMDRQVLEMAMLCESGRWLYTALIPIPGRKGKGQEWCGMLMTYNFGVAHASDHVDRFGQVT
jgi:hypothetical protein